MAAYTPFDYTTPTNDQSLSRLRVVTVDFPQGVLWTAAYGLAGANTITIQFTEQLQSASTTTSDYTLSGPSAPSISSVAFTAGSQQILLTLSGPLSVVSTYTLAINDRKALSGFKNPKWGTINWPNLLVDVILPSQIDTIGIGIDQLINLGSPSAIATGTATGAGIDQLIGIGSPTTSATNATTGVGIDQLIDLGSPSITATNATTGVGVDQVIDVGSPAVTASAIATGTGIDQLIDLGTPAVELDNVGAIGIGVNQLIGIGFPIVNAAGVLTPLQLSANQSAVLGDLDDALHKAFNEGTDGDTPNLIAPIEGYKDDFSPLQQEQTRLIFKNLAAATMVALNIPGVLTGAVITVPVAKITPGGANGSLTFTDGILTARVNPT